MLQFATIIIKLRIIMNKNHRVIWNCVRNCFVVASEKAKTNGKSSSTKSTVAAAVAAVFLSPGMASAVCSGASPVATLLSTSQCYTDIDVTINNGAGVTELNGNAIQIVSDYSSLLLNNGSLSGQVTSVDAQNGAGYIYSQPAAINNAAVLISGNLDGSLTNSSSGIISGEIDGSATATSADATYAYAYAYAGNRSQSHASGISVVDIGIAGIFSNSGQIHAVATASGTSSASVLKAADGTNDNAYAHAYSGRTFAEGMLINGNLNGGFLNDTVGSISALATTTATAAALLDNDIYTGGNGYVSSKSNSYSIAYGVHVGGGMGTDSSFNNRGSISANSISTAIGSASASSQYTYANAYSGARAYAGAYGLKVGNTIDLNSSINNDGVINSTASSITNTSASGSAIAMDALSRNNSYATAYGIKLNGGIMGGELTNQNIINATASGDSFSSAVGSGNVTSRANGGSSANGIIVRGFYNGAQYISLDGVIENSGHITSSSTGSSNSTANSTASIDNVTAGASSFASGYANTNGIYLNNFLAANASLANNGNVAANSTSTSNLSVATSNVTGDNAYANAYAGGRGDARSIGLGLGGGLLAGSSITNNSVINATADSDVTSNATANVTSLLSSAYAHSIARTYAKAYGLSIGSGGLDAGSSVSNHGNISAIANANAIASASTTGTNVTSDANAYSKAYATGVYIRGGMTTGATFDNTGSITSVATSTTQATAANTVNETKYARAYGVVFKNELQTGSTFSNTGTISALSNGADAEAYGVKINAPLNGSFINSGKISGATSADPTRGFSVYIDSGAGTVDNQLGGILQGNLYVGGTVAVTNSGTIYLPKGADAQIAGDYSQASSGVLKIDVSGADAVDYGKLAVAGTATIAGKADINVNTVNSLAIGQKLLGVVSAGTLVGNFTGVTDNSALFNFNSLVNANNIDLEVIKGLTATQAVLSTGNTSGTGAAGVFDNIIDGGTNVGAGMGAVITALGKLDTEKKVSDAVSQTLPLLTGGLPIAISNTLHETTRIVQSRQEGQQGSSSGDEFFGDKNAWFKPFGSWANQNDRKGVSGFDANTYGMMIGADSEISDTNRVGIAFAYAHSNIDGNSSIANQSASVNTYEVLAYGSHSIDDLTELSAQADIGQHNNKGTRNITLMGSVAKSDFTSWSGHVGLGLAHTYVLTEKTSLTPSVRADYTMIRDGGYNETGAGALNLNVNSNTTHELIFGLDGKITHVISDNAKLLANLGFGYDAINDKASITSAFAGAPSAAFVTNGIESSPWLVRGGLGVISKASETVEISARYDIEARKDFDNQTASVKVKWSF